MKRRTPASTDATADQIDWSAAAGTQQATWSDALYAGITSEVQSIDELLNIKTSYVRSTALDASVVTTSAELTPAQTQQYMNALSANSKVASVSPDMRRYATVDNTSEPVKINDPKMNRMWSLTGREGRLRPGGVGHHPRQGRDRGGAGLRHYRPPGPGR